MGYFSVRQDRTQRAARDMPPVTLRRAGHVMANRFAHNGSDRCRQSANNTPGNREPQ